MTLLVLASRDGARSIFDGNARAKYHQTTGKRYSQPEPHVPIESRPREPQRLADVVDLQALVGVQLLGEPDFGFSGISSPCVSYLTDVSFIVASEWRGVVSTHCAAIYLLGGDHSPTAVTTATDADRSFVAMAGVEDRQMPTSARRALDARRFWLLC